MVQSNQIVFRCNDKLYEKIKKKATKIELKPSEYCRKVLNQPSIEDILFHIEEMIKSYEFNYILTQAPDKLEELEFYKNMLNHIKSMSTNLPL